jgi:hypothetical protein
MSQPQFDRGAIVRARNFVGVLWQADGDADYVIPLVVQGAGRHRSDVQYEGEPLLPERGALRAGALMAIRAPLMASGRVSPDTVARLGVALQREVRARQFENRHIPRDYTERAVRM